MRSPNPDNCSVDPDFEEFGGVLTLAQIIDPVPGPQWEVSYEPDRRMLERLERCS